MEFNRDEMNCLITALIVAQRLPHEFAVEFLKTSGSLHMLLWKPFVELAGEFLKTQTSGSLHMLLWKPFVEPK